MKITKKKCSECSFWKKKHDLLQEHTDSLLTQVMSNVLKLRQRLNEDCECTGNKVKCNYCKIEKEVFGD